MRDVISECVKSLGWQDGCPYFWSEKVRLEWFGICGPKEVITSDFQIPIKQQCCCFHDKRCVMMWDETGSHGICPEASTGGPMSFLSDVVIKITEGGEGSTSTLKHFKHLFANLGPLLGLLELEHNDRVRSYLRTHCGTMHMSGRSTFVHMLLGWKYWSLPSIPFVGKTVKRIDWIDWCVSVWFDWLMCKCVVLNLNFFLFDFCNRTRTHDH